MVLASVPEPDPYVFGTLKIRISDYLYGSGSFHQQAKNLRLTMISSVLSLLNDMLSLKTGVSVRYRYLRNKQNKLFLASWKPLAKRPGTRSDIQ